MSMLSIQIAELREKARLFEGYQGGEISRMLREAADTIEGLRDRLQDAVLRSGTCEIKQHRCTSCDHEINDDAYYVRVNLDNGAWTAESRHANFCPNCGAKVMSE